MDRKTAVLLERQKWEWAVERDRRRRENRCLFTVCLPDDDLAGEVWCNTHTDFYYCSDTMEECRSAAREHARTHS